MKTTCIFHLERYNKPQVETFKRKNVLKALSEKRKERRRGGKRDSEASTGKKRRGN